jgi:hypothetical protein
MKRNQTKLLQLKVPPKFKGIMAILFLDKFIPFIQNIRYYFLFPSLSLGGDDSLMVDIGRKICSH